MKILRGWVVSNFGSLGEDFWFAKLLQGSLELAKRLNCWMTQSFGYTTDFGMKLHWNWLKSFEGASDESL
jgi:hypothetical protein